jgi:hypothetical protein
MWGGSILLKIVFSIALDSNMLWPEKIFKHKQVIMLVYALFEEVWSDNFRRGYGAPYQ